MLKVEALVRDALGHLDDPFYLQRHPLGSMLPADVRGSQTSGAQRAQAVTLRRELVQCVEDLHPISASEPSVGARHHRLLVLRYVDGLGPADICQQLAISQRQYYYDLTAAIAAVASRLAERWALKGVPPELVSGTPTAPGPRVPALPTPLTSFIGRRSILTELIASLGSVRLLTLTGPPGTGKTRLALELADTLAARTRDGSLSPAQQALSFPDGIVRIPLAAIRDPALVVPTVAQALGFREEGRSVSADALSAHLQGRRILLLLDNFEQVIAAGPQILAIVQACPDMTVLVTSRSPLRVRGEHEFAVPPLALPDIGGDIEAHEVCESVRLFAARAQAQNPAFTLTEQNQPAVERICRELDGLPLAIELAAARTRALPLEEIDARLDKSLDLLSRPSADAPMHQQGLRAALDWSWALLDPHEQQLFRSLSVFAGGCSLAAVRVVSGLSDPAALMERLVEKSLVITAERGNAGRPDHGFTLLEVVRQYAAEQLAAAGETSSIRQAHLEWCLGIADQGEQECFDPGHLASMRREHDNLRAALRWCIESANARSGFRLHRAAFGLWQVRGYYSEARSWFQELEALPSAREPSRERAGALATVAQIAYDQGEFEAAQRWAEESLAIFRTEADEAGAALATNVLGNVAYGRGDLARARRHYERGRQLNHKLGLRFWEAASIFALARTYVLGGATDRARELAEQGLRLAQPHGFPWITARLLRTLGRIVADAGDLATARSYYEQALAGQQALADAQGATQTLISLAQIATGQRQGARARALYTDALRQAHASGQLRETVLCLEGLAAQTSGRTLERGIRLTAATDEIRRAWGGVPWPRERAELEAWRLRAHAGVKGGLFESIAERGRRMALPDVVHLALGRQRARA